ncbi:MAG TPA: class I adenylate-forming enzyme family protein [Candidatus Binatia bacterium]|jgi:long-chain acyl-CoA synthetase
MLYRALELCAQKHGTKIAIVGERRSLTYNQLLRQAQSAAAHLQKLGLGTGDHLVVGIPPSPEFFVMFCAAAAIGVTTIPASPSGKVSSAIRDLEPAAFAGGTDSIAAANAGGLSPRHVIPWTPEHGLEIAPRPGRFIRRGIIRKETVLGTSSSGTTGEPLIFMRSAEALYRRARLGGIAWGIKPQDTMLSTGPFTSGVNTNYHLVLPIIQGTKIVVLENFQRGKVVDVISRERVSVLFAVPMVFDVLARLPAVCDADLSSLRRCISGGTHLPRDIYDRFYRRFGLAIGQGYGGVHFAPAFTVHPGGTPGAVGRKDGLFPVEIIDAKGKPVAKGRIGEIAFDAAKVRYQWAKTILQRNPNRRGRYVYTGDLGRVDQQGNLFVVGRRSAMIKVGANRVATAEVEDVLRSHPRVHDAIVFPLRTGQTDETVGAIVVRNGRLTSEELIEHCARQLDAYKCPRTISFRKSLRRNTHGKVIRYLYESPLQRA